MHACERAFSKDASLALQDPSLPPWNWRYVVVLRRRGVLFAFRSCPGQAIPGMQEDLSFLESPQVEWRFLGVNQLSCFRRKRIQQDSAGLFHISFIFQQGKGFQEAPRALQGKWGLQGNIGILPPGPRATARSWR